MEIHTTQVETAICVMCHGPNPSADRTCSFNCKIDLAFALGHITDYPEPQPVCLNCEAEPLEAGRVHTGIAPDGRTVTGCTYCIKDGRITHGHATQGSCQVCGRSVGAEACSPECAHKLEAETGWIVDDVSTTPAGHQPISVHRHHEYSLICSCGDWKGKSPIDLEGHAEHVAEMVHS